MIYLKNIIAVFGGEGIHSSSGRASSAPGGAEKPIRIPP
jgi:hypothetical protein